MPFPYMTHKVLFCLLFLTLFNTFNICILHNSKIKYRKTIIIQKKGVSLQRDKGDSDTHYFLLL